MSANPQMISLVRELRRMTQTHLAEAVGVRQGFISMIEAGVRDPSDDVVRLIANALDCPVTLLEEQAPVRGGEAQDLHFRRRKTLPVTERRRMEAKLHLSYLTVRGLLSGIDYEPSLLMPSLDIDDIDSPAEAARLVRRLWRIPTGPIPDLTAYLEAAGIFLIPCSAPSKIDAVTRRCEEGWHVTAYNKGMPVDRDRLTRAHELGHLILHERYSGADAEEEANEFAAELLAPADEIYPHLAGITTRDLGKLIDLRMHWKVSVPFFVHRAADLGCISERQQRSFYQLLNSRGLMHQTVDHQLPPEQPTLLTRIIDVHRTTHEYTLDDLAESARMTPQRFGAKFGQPQHEAAEETTLRSSKLKIVR
ncbi:XRE family transcriptional regulator [Amycolatopsis roodepoortensis]|uniref:XRE family transcriptional regulator n=1 Tax=Amycolatopsis roodepoortensis TaxID=700274 RepID=UPI00214C1147|nr:XRE family transcriptional regulator [Amycolatopsis roodepoortensis]UUV35852.1 XRE family transcriptional regulator [Amycolatopsis roodepoortensis]